MRIRSMKGDKIVLFGFSRGAYTARYAPCHLCLSSVIPALNPARYRALAAMLHCVGLLSKHNLEQLSFAYKVFKLAPTQTPPWNWLNIFLPSVHLGREERWEATLHFKKTSRGTLPSTSLDCGEYFIGHRLRWSCLHITAAHRDTVSSVGLFPRSLPNTTDNPSVLHMRHALALDETRVKFRQVASFHRLCAR